MKIKKCEKCKREREIKDNLVMFICRCGNIIEMKGGKNKWKHRMN